MAVYYSPGRYSCRIKQQGIEKSKKGKDMLVFVFRPEAVIGRDEEGNDTLDGSIFAEHDRTARLVIDPANEAGMDYTMKKLRFAGFTGITFSELNLVDKLVILKCEPSEYNGKETESWEFPLPELGEREVKALDSKEARRLDALFGKKLKEGAKPAPTKKPPTDDTASIAASGGADVPEEDEVPF